MNERVGLMAVISLGVVPIALPVKDSVLESQTDVESKLGPMAEDSIKSVGVNVRRLREALGINITELSERTGLSRQMVALVERGDSNPSIATLARIAGSLGVSLATLVESPIGPGARLIPPEAFQVLWRSDKGSVGKLVFASTAPHSVELWIWQIQGGCTYEASGEHAEEFLLVNEGKVLVKWGDEDGILVPQHHAARLPLEQAYSLTAIGKQTATCILMYVPV